MTRVRSRVMLLIEAAIVLQVGHQVEHIAQMFQMHAQGQPPAFAHGLVGRLDLEWVHFGLTVTIAVVALIALTRWPRNPVAWLLMPLSLWHLAEHSAILITYLRTGITGAPGILARGGLLNGPLARPDLHFIYNAAILLLLIGVWAWQRWQPRELPAKPTRHLRARLVAAAATAGVAASLSLLVVPGAQARWLDHGVSLQAALNSAPAGSVLHLRPGLYSGPLLFRRPVTLIGPATIVGGADRPTITITASKVNLADITVMGGETGIFVTRASSVRLENVRVVGAIRRGIDISQASVQLHRCEVTQLVSAFAWGIGVVNSMGRAPTTVESCAVTGGQEGIVSHASTVFIKDNDVRSTTLRAISVTEMSQGDVDQNRIEQVMGTGLYCGDHSVCNMRDNRVRGIAPQRDTPVTWNAGYGAIVLYGSDAYFKGNDFQRVARAGIGVFVDSAISTRPLTMSMD
ncbi:MAG: right-handed parallel beta-helix repeat-containing protein [Candidatus Dormibacteraeota bacterium]|nr:right-handed parallel beta-helix repeat-containing protein [Candidatus Dormibacteraeota bacterium]